MSHTEISSTAVIDHVEPRKPDSLQGIELAGYKLEERLGVGGFGEVWRATGPGGFCKAVKILFGLLNGPQAETELKSLHRMRDLRHPFLLSIERVEVVDSRVIVVTELADRSLDQRFRELLSAGQRGVAREELLRYLKDAADALDFMSEEHGLQHLDIKPENILLQGMHAKVGDFGLTKAVGTARHSQVNGFTPLYAPPELFDGKPDRGSDQYSLAIVYQTMLTGIPPFSGRTASQLMAQHLKSSPDLTSLLPSDRAVVARALSKNPRTRFSGCRQFIDELLKRRPTKSLGDHSRTLLARSSPDTTTDLASTENITSNHSMLHGSATPLSPVNSLPEDGVFRPTLFIGIGGLGCRTVFQLNQRIQRRFSNCSIPSLQFLCIDSDSQAVASLKTSRPERVCTFATCHTPLRTTQEYRKASAEHLAWLSRRWLYNIPRSGRVEGLRPLGRLSFVDHVGSVRSAIQSALAAIVNPQSHSTSSMETGMEFDPNGIDVCLVGSTSGGTSSGCLLDASWLVRELAMNGRMPPVRVSAILLHGTAHGRQFADMQDGNTVSFLQELQHFSVPGAQRPGLTTRFSDFEATKPFDETVFVHLGDDLSDRDFEAGVGKASEYLELWAVTSARQELNAWRNPGRTQQPETGEASLRTFGLSSINAEAWVVAHQEAGQVATAAINSWLAGSAAPPDSNSPEWVNLLDQLSLSSDAVPLIIPGLLDNRRTRRLDEYAGNVLKRFDRESSASVALQIGEIIQRDAAAGAGVPDSVSCLANEVRAQLKAQLPENLQQIDTFLSQILEVRIRPAVAEQMLTALLRRIDYALAACQNQKHDLDTAFNDLCASQQAANRDAQSHASQTVIKGFCRQYCMLVTCQAICQNVIENLKALQSSLPQFVAGRLNLQRERLKKLGAIMNGGAASPATIPEQMISAFESHLRASGRFRANSLQSRDVRSSDAAALLSDATNFLLLSMSASAQLANDNSSQRRSEAFPASAKPRLQNVGGGQRVLAVMSDAESMGAWVSMLQNDFGACVSACSVPADEVSVICEVEGVALPAAIDALTRLPQK